MKKYFLTIIILIQVSFLGLSQTQQFEFEMLKSCFIQNDNGTLGTGILYNDSTRFFLITARHNFYQEIKNGKQSIFALTSKSTKLLTYPRNIKNAIADTLLIDLIEAEKSYLLKYDTINDVATILLADIIPVDSIYSSIVYKKEINRLDSKSTRIIGFSKNELCKFNKINIGDDIAIIGYPRAIGLFYNHQYDFDRPLLRKGSIAGTNESDHTIIIDCIVYGGNSGGPVIRFYEDVIQTKKGIAFVHVRELIGIVSEFIPLEEKWKNLNYGNINIQWDNSGYGVVVPIDYAIELIEKY